MWGSLSYTLLTLGIPAALGLALGLGLISQSPPEERSSRSWIRVLHQLRRAVATGTFVELSTAVLTYITYRGPSTQGDRRFIMYVLLESAPLAVLIGLSTVVVSRMRNLEPGLGIGLSIGLCVGCSTGIAHVLLSEPLRDALYWALLAGVAAGVCAGLVGPLKPAERLSWSWRRARSRWRIPLVVIVVAEATIGTQWGTGGELATGVVIGLLVGVIAWLAGGMTANSVPLYVTPNEGIRRSVRNGVSAGAITTLTTGSLTVLTEGGLSNGAIVGLSSGFLAAVAYGLGAGIQHGLLRLLLFRYNLAPLRYVRWLDSMVQLRLLYRGVSGGYVFIHGVVQEYFVEMVPVRAADVSRP